MIVERWTWKAKSGCRNELVELVKGWVEIGHLTPRVCTFTYGAWDIVTSDLEFETVEDQQKFWSHMTSTREHAVTLEKLADMVVPGTTTHELLQVH